MRSCSQLSGVVLLAVACGCNQPPVQQPAAPAAAPAVPAAKTAALPAGRLVDLSYAYGEDTVYWPTAEGFRLKADFVGLTDKGYYYSAYQFATAEHGGTHIDAPVHFSQGGESVDAIPLSRLMGEAVVIDVTAKCTDQPDYQINVGDLRAWEEKHGRELKDVIVILRTGWGARWPDREKYLGTSERGREGVAKLHFPGLDPLAARWLAEQRSVKAVGIDTASIDYGRSTLFESHVTLFKANIPALENVAHADELPEQGALLIALPIKIQGGSGGPTRVVAIIP
jgi:kynurenine formamidase